jgi:hypothetical protein
LFDGLGALLVTLMTPENTRIFLLIFGQAEETYQPGKPAAYCLQAGPSFIG